MPVNFGDTIIEGQIKPEVEVQAPVQDKSGLYLAEAANSALTGIGSIFGGMVKGAQEDEANGVLNNYRQEAVLIAEAVDQGQLSLQAARGRLRVLYSNALANNPSLGADIDSVHSKLMEQYGIGSVIKAGNEQTARELDVANNAFAAGWVAPDGTPDVTGYQTWQRAVTEAETIQREVATRSAVRGEVSALDKERLEGVVRNMASAGLPWVDEQVARAASLLDNGGDPAEIIAQLRADVGTVIGDFKANSGGMDIAYITEPIEARLKMFEDMALGNLETEVFNAQIASMKARGEYAFRMSDPELASLLVMSDLFGQNAQAIIEQRLTGKAVDILSNSLRPYDPAADDNAPPPDVIGTEGDVKAALDELNTTMIGGAAEPTPRLEQEVGTSVTNLLRSVRRYNAENVKDYRNIVDFFAGQGVQKWVDNGQLIVPESVQTEASRVIEEQYQNVLLPLVEEQWINAQHQVQAAVNSSLAATGSLVGGSGEIPEGDPSNLIQPVWNGSSVSFQPAPGYEDNAYVRSVVKGLNEGENAIAPPLNTLIRAKAHMNGSTDYNAEWELFGPRLFGLEGEAGNAAGGDSAALNYAPMPEDQSNSAVSAIQAATFDPLAVAPADISLTDFNEDMEAVYATVEQTSAVDPRGMVEATSPIEVARAFLGYSENNADQNRVLSAFIKESTGTNINPAKTAWCAAFLNAVLGGGTGQLNARSYLDWGVPVDQPKVGDVVVLSRGDPNGWQGHVGFFMGFNNDGTVKILGANQSDSVSEEDFNANRILGFRRAA